MNIIAMKYKLASDFCTGNIVEEDEKRFQTLYAKDIYFKSIINLCKNGSKLSFEDIGNIFNRLYYIHQNLIENYKKNDGIWKQILLKWYMLQNEYNDDEFVSSLVDLQKDEICKMFPDVKEKFKEVGLVEC